MNETEYSEIVIFGSGGFAREVLQVIEDLNESWMGTKKMKFIGFLDGDNDNHGAVVNGYPVLGGIDWLKENENTLVVIGVGSPATKRKIVNEIKQNTKAKFAKLIHPKVINGDFNEIGEGSIICAGTILTNNITIGEHVILNLSCTIGHDSTLEDFVTVAPGVNISGNCLIKEGVDFGTSATIIQGKEVGEWSIIGAGAVVVKDVPGNVTSVGNPAKVIKEREEHWQLY